MSKLKKKKKNSEYDKLYIRFTPTHTTKSTINVSLSHVNIRRNDMLVNKTIQMTLLSWSVNNDPVHWRIYVSLEAIMAWMINHTHCLCVVYLLHA